MTPDRSLRRMHRCLFVVNGRCIVVLWSWTWPVQPFHSQAKTVLADPVSVRLRHLEHATGPALVPSP